MTGEEQGKLRDMQGFIEFCIKHDTSMGYCLGNLGHDVNLLLLSAPDGSSPRTAGYAKELDKEEEG